MENGPTLDLPGRMEKPSIYLGPSALQQHHDLQESSSHEDMSLDTKSPWLSKVRALMQRPKTTSIMWDAQFLQLVSEEDWAIFLVDLQNRSTTASSSIEYQFDLRGLRLASSANNHHSLTLSRLQEVLEVASFRATKIQGNVHKIKIVFLGMTSGLGQAFACLPLKLTELEVYFSSEGELDANQERERRSRVDSVVQQYVAPLQELTCLTIMYDDVADDNLPVSTYSLASLLRCETLSKLELIGCNVSADPDDDVFHDVPPDHAVFEALSSNASLRNLRFRSGRISTSCAETICRSVEVGNRSLHHLDFGNMEIPDSVAGAVFKAVARNQVLCSLELNLNSLQDFGFASLNNLVCMDLSDNYLGDEGALQLAQAIPSSGLSRINLAENCIGPIGGCAIAWSLQYSKTLTKMNLCDNPLCDTGAGDGPTSDITRTVHNAFKNTPGYRQGFLGMLCTSLRQNKALEFLNLGNTGIDDSHGPLLAILLRVSHLTALGLLRNNIGDDAFLYMCQSLAKYRPPLRALLMQVNNISSRGFYALWRGVLNTNDTLVSVQFGDAVFDIEGMDRGQRDLDIAIGLNRAGLIRLRNNKNATRKDWFETLLKLRDNVDCSFSLLQENPLICKCL